MHNKLKNISLCNLILMKNNTNYSCLTIWKMLCVDTIFKMAAAVCLLLLQIGLFRQNKWCSMGENAFHMVFQDRWVFSHSSPNPALASYAALSRIRWARGRKLHLSWKTMWNAYQTTMKFCENWSTMINDRCLMEISIICYCLSIFLST